jgi:cytochrome c1
MTRPLEGYAIVLSLVLAAALPVSALAQETAHASIARQTWSFAGFTGQYDKAQLQRGFQIYQQVCSACHGLKRVRFRNLAEPGGPEFPEASVKALAAQWPNQVSDGPDDSGKMFDRPAKLADPILGPYKNDKEARAAQGGALPPDLSLIGKARSVEYTGSVWFHPFSMLRDIALGYQEGGADYVYALLTGYGEKPSDMKMADGMHYNVAFPGHQVAMPPPLAADNFVKYQDGKGSLDENARDIAAFLSWTADPKLDDRKNIGWLVMLYLLVTTGLLYLGKRRIWSRIPH